MTRRSSIYRVEGADEVRKALRSVDGGLADLKTVHAEAARTVEAAARPDVPHRTGRLATTLRSSGQARAGVVRAGTAGVDYAPFVHFGVPSRGQRPQPFIYDAVDARSADVLAVYETAVDKVLAKHHLT